MTKRRLGAAFALTLAAALSAGWIAVRNANAASGARSASRTGQMSDLADRDIQIAVWKKALAADSLSAIALGQLAGLFMQRGRESGDESNYLEAEQYARRSVAERTNRNGASFVTLASALLAQHRFREADSIVTVLVGFEPDIPQYRSMLGEIKLELGDYDAARFAFDSMYSRRTHLSIAPRLARWMELNGNSAGARKLLIAALEDAKRRRDIPREQLAWFYLRVGDIELRNGRHRAARAAFMDGLRVEPDDYRLLAAMAHLEAAGGNPARAIEYGERAMDMKLDPATLGTIGDAYAARGDTARAEDYFKTMEVAVAGQPGAFHRAWSLFLLDHGRRTGEVLDNTQAELETRKDIYGYDLMAWALYKSGRFTEATVAMKQAMRLGTQDAMLYYHAGMIARAGGDNALARSYLERALHINPRFHPTQPREARGILASMER